MDKSTTIIFLDIDGVLQPHGQQDRFQHDMEKLREELAVKYEDDAYLTIDRYDLAAVYYDWRTESVEYLRQLCIEFDAKIVISSDWRNSSPLPTLKAFFRLYDLDQYLVGVTVQDSQSPLFRAGEVKQYLDEHPEIERFVIIDDRYGSEFKSIYPHNFVYTISYITDEHYQRARQIFNSTLPHHEVTQLEDYPEYGDFVTEIDTGRVLAAVGHRENHTYVNPLYTPRGINVLQAQAFGDPHHNGIFVTHNDVIFEERHVNFCCNSGAWYRGSSEPVKDRGIIHHDKAPTIEQLPEGIRFIYEMTWSDANDAPIFDEIRTFDIYEGEDGNYCDVTSQHIASYGDIQFPHHIHGSMGVHVQPHLLPNMGGKLIYWTGDYSAFSNRNQTTFSRYVAIERDLPGVGAFGVCLSVLQNSKPNHRYLRGPWLANNGIIMFFPNMRYGVEIDAGDSWTFGLRVVAYDGLFGHERAEVWNDRLA